MRVVHCKNEKFDIYCGRATKEFPGSKWANPFKMENDSETERWRVVILYELYLNSRPDLLKDVFELRDKVLGCWCSPKKCHCDILAAYSQSPFITNWFSNMFKMDKPLLYQGIEFHTSENFYQAMKLPKKEIALRAEIAAMPPHKAKKAIRNKDKYKWREDWNQEESLKVMEYILRFKFRPGTIWHLKLMMSEWELTEWNNWGDIFWGKDINTRSGENQLGKILMKLRNEYDKDINDNI